MTNLPRFKTDFTSQILEIYSSKAICGVTLHFSKIKETKKGKRK